MSRTIAEPTLPSGEDALSAREAVRILDTPPADTDRLRLQMLAAGREVAALDLPEPAVKLLREVLDAMASGRAVAVVPVDTEITTQEAAYLINVSRPFVVSLVEKGVLPARMVGNQRRLRLEDVLAYKAQARDKALDAMREIAAIDRELGLP